MALMSLIAAHDRNMQEVCSSGALTQVLQTMRAQRDNSSVLDACVRMLLNLVLKKSDVHGGAICREGGILVLMDAIEAHPEDTNLQARCQSLLKKIDSSGVQQRQGEWIMAAQGGHYNLPLVWIQMVSRRPSSPRCLCHPTAMLHTRACQSRLLLALSEVKVVAQ